jgi:RES domain-containing protein
VLSGGWVLGFPSSLVSRESNFLLNPQHPEFSRLQIGDPLGYELDFRLKKSTKP